MIKNLTINNIALIEHIDISFEKGLTVLTGETGSGKSIIIDALSFVLGERADKTLIKYGEDFADVTALFEVEASCPVIAKLEEYGFGGDCEILISRKMSVGGKNEIRIQGKVATLAILKEVCAELVDIFGQGQHLALLNEKNQLGVLDAFCDFGDIATQMREQLYPEYLSINKQLKAFGGSDAERERLMDILKYQIEEIENANLSEDEELELESAHKRMVFAEKIATAVGQAVVLLGGDGGASQSISQASNNLKNIANVEQSATELSERLTSARIEVEDVCATLEDVLSQTEISPAEIDKLENRLEQIKTIKRKYGGSIADALKFLADAKAQYDNLCNSSEKIAQLTAQKQKVVQALYQLANQKSKIRKQTASVLAQRIMDELGDLGMRGTTFVVHFNDQPSLDDFAKSVCSDGYDKVEFLMSANIGEPVKPLAKVISGGEMSRFMLAVKNITALAEQIPTMVFDEIDTGISGNMAQMVATKLANVSASSSQGYQCIVITHLPQICAMADTNLFIEKYEQGGKTHTSVHQLCDDSQKANEVARLMGGVGEHSIVNAQELIAWSQNYKQSIK